MVAKASSGEPVNQSSSESAAAAVDSKQKAHSAEPQVSGVASTVTSKPSSQPVASVVSSSSTNVSSTDPIFILDQESKVKSPGVSSPAPIMTPGVLVSKPSANFESKVPSAALPKPASVETVELPSGGPKVQVPTVATSSSNAAASSNSDPKSSSVGSLRRKVDAVVKPVAPARGSQQRTSDSGYSTEPVPSGDPSTPSVNEVSKGVTTSPLRTNNNNRKREEVVVINSVVDGSKISSEVVPPGASKSSIASKPPVPPAPSTKAIVENGEPEVNASNKVIPTKVAADQVVVDQLTQSLASMDVNKENKNDQQKLKTSPPPPLADGKSNQVLDSSTDHKSKPSVTTSPPKADPKAPITEDLTLDDDQPLQINHADVSSADSLSSPLEVSASSPDADSESSSITEGDRFKKNGKYSYGREDLVNFYKNPLSRSAPCFNTGKDFKKLNIIKERVS